MWRKKEMKDGGASRSKGEEGARRLKLVQEITKVRQRRDEREKELEEMERLKNEEVGARAAHMTWLADGAGKMASALTVGWLLRPVCPGSNP